MPEPTYNELKKELSNVRMENEKITEKYNKAVECLEFISICIHGKKCRVCTELATECLTELDEKKIIGVGMTNWEIGQDLIHLSDEVGDKVADLNRGGYTELAIRLDIIRAQIGDLFNENNDHAFGIFDSASVWSQIGRGRKDA
jgi:hypothetical protein